MNPYRDRLGGERSMLVLRYLRRFFLALIVFYRKFISSIFYPSCRYYPSCSLYALTLFRLTHPLHALFFSIIRVLKCNPYSRGGYDYPVIKIRIAQPQYRPIETHYWFVPLKPLKIPICMNKPIECWAYILLKD